MPLLNIVHRLITVRLNKFIAQIILTKLTIVMTIALQLKQYLRIKSKHTFDQLVGSKRIKKKPYTYIQSMCQRVLCNLSADRSIDDAFLSVEAMWIIVVLLPMHL